MELMMGTTAAVAVVALFMAAPYSYFVPDACSRLEKTLEANVVGQDLAIKQFVDAICEHLTADNPVKPLVISVHGPPGVGKTYTHLLAAKAMYGLEGGGGKGFGKMVSKSVRSTTKAIGSIFPSVRLFGSAVADAVPQMKPLECPGRGCAGYKVVYGMDYVRLERETHHAMLRNSLLKHFQSYKESLMVVEEYDKLDCDTRGMLRQLIQHPESANLTIGRSVIVLESNLGMFELKKMIEEAKGRNGVTPEQAHQKLKDMIFEYWSLQKCEGFTDTLKLTNLVDFYLPYFPLEKRHIVELIEKQVGNRAREHREVEVTWAPRLISFLLSKIEFFEDHPADGGKDVDVVVTRHLGKVLREFWKSEQGEVRKIHLSVGGMSGGEIKVEKIV